MLSANFDIRETIKEFLRNYWLELSCLSLVLMLSVTIVVNYETLFAKTKSAVRVVVEPGFDSAIVADVNNTITTFDNFTNETFGIRLPKEIAIFLCPTKEQYAVVLEREFGQAQDAANRNARLTGGYYRGSIGKVAINFDTSMVQSLQRRIQNNTAHELFHMVQYQLAGDYLDSSYYWLREGSADFVGAAVAERLGGQNLEAWKTEQFNTVKFAQNYATSNEIFHTTLSKWTDLMEQKKCPYEMSDLMVFYLMSEVKKDGYKCLAEYFRLLGSSTKDDKAFEQAFGITTEKFLNDFQQWFTKTTPKVSQVNVVLDGDIRDETAKEIKSSVNLSRRILNERLGTDLKDSIKIVYTDSKLRYIIDLNKELGLSGEEAKKLAGVSVWSYNGNTIVINAAAANSRQLLAFNTASAMTRLFAQNTAGATITTGVSWLITGSAEVMGAYAAEAAGTSSMDKYRLRWQETTKKAQHFVDLAELLTPKAMAEANSLYGEHVVSATACLGALYLMEHHGSNSLKDWLQLAKLLNNPKDAFRKVYGKTAEEFSVEFRQHLNTLH